MSRTTAARIAWTLLLIMSGSGSALAWGWWERCDYTCYGPPYGNITPPPTYVYDHKAGPTWTGNGWAYLPSGTYYPQPPVAAPPPTYRSAPYREPHWRRRLLRPFW
ncbi:MAG: hypothetical protein K2X43_02560 [Hyphomonadaceae bacterium]|jgi:hypothetical protein|nr:hypothetical protein [Hyphomonadaceae bacterium]